MNGAFIVSDKSADKARRNAQFKTKAGFGALVQRPQYNTITLPTNAIYGSEPVYYDATKGRLMIGGKEAVIE